MQVIEVFALPLDSPFDLVVEAYRHVKLGVRPSVLRIVFNHQVLDLALEAHQEELLLLATLFAGGGMLSENVCGEELVAELALVAAAGFEALLV